MVTTKPFLKKLEQQVTSIIKLKSKLCATYIELCKNFGKKYGTLDINTTIL